MGSSPLARGAPAGNGSARCRAGLIPARAGSTLMGALPRRVPRGSSPLARGARSRLSGARPSLRLIPARAGSTVALAGRPGLAGAHPRSRGEHASMMRHRGAWAGSSPLARGARPDGPGSGLRRGLIPARAGSTRPAAIAASAVSGSSPLARGAPGPSRTAPRRGRLIPARAGSTRPWSLRSTTRTAHPRSRGEHAPPFHISRYSTGSSPLARGARVGRRLDHAVRGLIPARAGSTRRALTGS